MRMRKFFREHTYASRRSPRCSYCQHGSCAFHDPDCRMAFENGREESVYLCSGSLGRIGRVHRRGDPENGGPCEGQINAQTEQVKF